MKRKLAILISATMLISNLQISVYAGETQAENVSTIEESTEDVASAEELVDNQIKNEDKTEVEIIDTSEFESVSDEEEVELANYEEDVTSDDEEDITTETNVNEEDTNGSDTVADSESDFLWSGTDGNSIAGFANEDLKLYCTKIVIPERATGILSKAFVCYFVDPTYGGEKNAADPNNANYRNSSLLEIDFSNATNLTYIGSEAFRYSRINKLDFSKCNRLTSIEASAFRDCRSLSELKLSANLNTIGASAFSGCIHLTDLTLTENISSIGSSAFSGCKYTKTDKTITGLTNVVVNSTNLEKLPKGIFSQCAIQSVRFGSNVKYVADNLFANAGFLTIRRKTDNSFDTDEDDENDGENNYEDKNKKQIQTIDTFAVVEIPVNITKIGKSAFERAVMKSLIIDIPTKEQVNQGLGLTVIDDSAFQNCTYKIQRSGKNEDEGEEITVIWIEYFGFETLQVPWSNLTTIGKKAFYGDGGIKSMNEITFGASDDINANDKDSSRLLEIGEYAFAYCEGIKKVVIPSTVTKIDKGVFSWVTSLETLVCKDNITYLPDAFCEFTSLTDTFNFNKIRSLGKNTFKNTKFVNLVLPDTIEQLGDYCFSVCEVLETVRMSRAIQEIPTGCFYATSIRTVQWAYMVKGDGYAGLQKIGNYAFADATKSTTSMLVDVVLPDGLIEIGNFAFANNRLLSTIKIPDSTARIGDSAFLNDQSITIMTITPNITTLGSKVFKNCKIKELHIKANGITKCGANNFTDNVLEDVTFETTVTNIPSNMFREATYKTGAGITIPKTIEEIGDYAFAGTKGSTNAGYFNFENGSQIKTIGKYAFAYRSNLSTIAFPETLIEIGDYAFTDDVGFKIIRIPASVKAIGKGAFSGCTGAVSLDFEKGSQLEIISEDVFSGCTSIKSADIPYGVESIGNGAFKNCSALTHLFIPSNVTKIGNTAFQAVSREAFRTSKDTEAYKFLSNAGLAGSNIDDDVLTVTYMMGDGESNSPKNSTCFEDATLGHVEMIFQPATKPDSQFQGWFTDETLQTQILSTSGVTTNLILYPKFAEGPEIPLEQEGMYKITYVVTKNTENDKDNPSYYIPESMKSAIKLKNPKNNATNAAFNGWYTVKNDKLTKITSITKNDKTNYKLYGIFKYTNENDSYTITLDANGGKLSNKYTTFKTISASVEDGFFIPVKLDTATKDGKIFSGWSLDNGKKAEPVIRAVPDADDLYYVDTNYRPNNGKLILYAVWADPGDISGEVIYNFNIDSKDYTIGGGEFTAKTMKKVQKKGLKYSPKKKLSLQKPVREGFTFKEWIIEDSNGKKIKNKKAIPKGIIALPVKVTPVWIENYYFITYMGNGGTISNEKKYKDEKEHKYTVSFNTVSSNSMKHPDNKKFLGWSLSKKDTSPKIMPGESVSKLTAKKKKKLKLYAIWN